MPQSEFHEKLGNRGSNKGGQFNKKSGTNESTFQSGKEGSWQGKSKAPKIEDSEKE